jgi:flagellar hook-associated protein 3 FlgL
MLRGIQGQNPTFLTDLDRIEARLSKANNHLTTGIRVSQASDDPTAITDILKYQGQIDHLQQIQTNLAAAKVNASTADGALQSASSILDQLTSIATQGASDTSSQTTRAQLGQQVQELQRQLVAVANTTVNGRYVFGGDDPSVVPFTFDWTVPGGVVSNSTSGATGYLQNGDGSWITASMTGSEVFDATTAGVPAANKVTLFDYFG